MGNIIGSCGHDITDSFEKSGLWHWDYDGGERCLFYGAVCPDCRSHYEVATQEEVSKTGAFAQPWEVSDVAAE